MLNLALTTDKLSLITVGAATVDVHASWVDDLADAMTAGKTNTAITTATTTDIVAAPAASTVRNVKWISIRNKDAGVTSTCTVQFNANGTLFELMKATALLPGEELVCREGIWFHYDTNGGVYGQLAQTTSPLNNFSTASQAPAAATLTQLVGSTITVPSGKLRIGTLFKWKFDITKTAAGTATSAYHIRIGTANTTADTAIITFTKPLGTAVIDTGLIEIMAVVRGPLTSSCILAGLFELRHNLATTGHNVTPATATPAFVFTVSGAFDATVANLFVSLSCTTGASDAITTQVLFAEAWNL